MWLVDLAQVDVETPLLEHLLHALNCDFATLRARHALLVLDNCEHRREACKAVVETLLDAAPQLTILATSREALQASLETVQPLLPLTF